MFLWYRDFLLTDWFNKYETLSAVLCLPLHSKYAKKMNMTLTLKAIETVIYTT